MLAAHMMLSGLIRLCWIWGKNFPFSHDTATFFFLPGFCLGISFQMNFNLLSFIFFS